MIILSTTSDKVQVVLGGSVTTNQLKCFVSYTDTTTGTDYQRVDAGLTYNPFTNTLTTTTFAGNATSAASTSA